MTRNKRAEIRERFACFISDVGVYTFAVLGVFVSKYLPQFRTGGIVELQHIEIGTLLMSCIIAFMISFGMDYEGDSEGKRKNWKRRAAYALANGAMWHTIIGG